MNESILFAIWLKINCTDLINNAYCYKSKLFYIDSLTDMKALFEIFKNEN